jgi:hypothetical protein
VFEASFVIKASYVITNVENVDTTIKKVVTNNENVPANDIPRDAIVVTDDAIT